MRSVRTLLTEAIDYAGLFPPAGLSMSDAVLNYATYRNSNYSWMLGRFVVMAGRLEELYESAIEFTPKDGANPWRVSVVAGEDVVDTMHLIKNFNEIRGELTHPKKYAHETYSNLELIDPTQVTKTVAEYIARRS